MKEKDKVSPIFARLSLGLATIPIGFYTLLMTSGGSEGFGVWNDIVLLLALVLITAVVGLILSGFSSKRNERSKTNVVAVIIHCVFLLLLAFALSQGM